MNTLHNIVYKVNDLDAAKALHAVLLDAQPHTDQPYYVGFNVGGIEIGLTPTPPGEAAGGVAHIGVSDLDAVLDRLQTAGATRLDEPRDVGGGNRVATVRDADGTVLGLIERAG